MVLEKLGSSLKNTLSKIAKSVFVDEKVINELVKDIQRALLTADVNVKLVFSLTAKIKERALKEEAPQGVAKRDHIIKIVYEELTNFLGKDQKKIKIEEPKPFKIMLVGLFGSGKTTHCGKLAKYYATRGNKVAILGLDVHRPAAMSQLEQIGKRVNVPVLIDRDTKDPIQIIEKFRSQFSNYDLLLIDTAGRDALSDDLIEEIEAVNKALRPDERLLVLSADIGQAAQKQAVQFHESVNVSGVIVTKMDGTAKAGGALSACATTQAPIVFIGVGEQMEDLESFNPEGFVSRLLGMGDLQALLEKAEGAISKEDAADLGKKFLSGDFNLIDLYEQMQAMKKMGPLTKVMDMIPGMGNLKLPKEMLEVQQGKLEKWRFAMDSMTKKELEEPELIDRSRIERIAQGSAVSQADIRLLLKQHKQSKKMMKMFKGKGAGDMKSVENMMKKMGGVKGMGNMKGMM